jgi:polyhydroxyalkanoate synthesis repressor PhaR
MRVLKKYPNRRIYDTESSKFVALAEIRQMITDRESIQVLHSKTGEDLTRSVLMQVITEMEQEGHASLLTNRVLEELIRFYGDKIVAMMGPYLEQQILQSLASQDQLIEHLTKAFTQPYPTPEQAIKSMIEQYQVFTGQTPPPGDTPSGEAPTDDAVDDELGDKK